MRIACSMTAFALIIVGVLSGAGSARAEVVEEIIAWVNGDVITSSEYHEELQGRTAELYRRFSGEELDQEIEQSRKELLLSIIDRKILLYHAKALGYDMDMMGDAYLKGFKQQQGIKTDEELRRLAEGDGMTVAQVRERLVELYAPSDIIDMEVVNRISVSDGAIQAFYEENAMQFRVEGEVTLREIVLLADSEAARERRRAEAQAVLDRALSGEDFDQLAIEVSEVLLVGFRGSLYPIRRFSV